MDVTIKNLEVRDPREYLKAMFDDGIDGFLRGEDWEGITRATGISGEELQRFSKKLKGYSRESVMERILAALDKRYGGNTGRIAELEGIEDSVLDDDGKAFITTVLKWTIKRDDEEIEYPDMFVHWISRDDVRVEWRT